MENKVDRIKDFKTVFSCLPNKRSDDREFEHFSGFIYTYNSFIKSRDETERERFGGEYNYHLEKLWAQILHEFMNPMWWHEAHRFNENLVHKMRGPFDIYNVRLVLREANKKGEFSSFFKAYPYIEDLLFIDEFFSGESKSGEDLEKLWAIVVTYQVVLKKYDSLFPILVLKEHVNLMRGSTEFDQEFYSKHMNGASNCLRGDNNTQFLFLSMFVHRDISYSIKVSDVAFRKFDWDTLGGLPRAICSRKLEEIIGTARFSEILESIDDYLTKLILFEIGGLGIDEVPEVSFDDLLKIKTETNLKPAFEIIEHYLDIVEKIEASDADARLAILRVITAVGEAVFKIKLLIPTEELGLLKKLSDLRDRILHSSTKESYKYLQELISDNKNNILDKVLIELKNLKGFFIKLKLWFDSSRALDVFPDLPDLSSIKEFEEQYILHRKKDDRDVKLSLADYSVLEASIPQEDSVGNKLMAEIRAFANGDGRISREDFIKACKGAAKSTQGEYWSTGELKKIHEKIIELNKIKMIHKALLDPDFDFSKVSLNLSKDAKPDLEALKQKQDEKLLKDILADHKQKNDLNIDVFLKSVEVIDLIKYKETLRSFIGEKVVSKSDFDDAVQVVFSDDDRAKSTWRDAYTKYYSQIESYKRDQARQVEYAIGSIDILKEIAEKIYTGRGLDMESNPVKAIACEMQYGLCVNNIKSIISFIDQMHDYSDKSLYFICLPHPIKTTKDILEGLVTARNDLFHFERTFDGDSTIFGHRFVWFSILEKLTHGMCFLEAINGVSREPMTSDSDLFKLKEYLKLVQNSIKQEESDTINVYKITMSDSEHSFKDKASVHIEDIEDIEDYLLPLLSYDDAEIAFLLGYNPLSED
jgi:hypothetical protein